MREIWGRGGHEKKKLKGSKGRGRDIYVGVVEAEVSGIPHFFKYLAILKCPNEKERENRLEEWKYWRRRMSQLLQKNIFFFLILFSYKIMSAK